jgi:hypothetical protein
MKPVVPLYFSVLLASLLCIPAQSQVTARATTLRAEPHPGAKEVAALPAGARLAIGKREGYWVLATVASNRGWLRMTDLSFAQPGGAVSLAGLDSGRLGKGNIVASAAARGLSADALRQAKPDYAAVAALASLSGNPEALRSFRSEGGLATVALPQLRQRADASSSAAAPAVPVTATKGTGNEDW